MYFIPLFVFPLSWSLLCRSYFQPCCLCGIFPPTGAVFRLFVSPWTMPDNAHKRRTVSCLMNYEFHALNSLEPLVRGWVTARQFFLSLGSVCLLSVLWKQWARDFTCHAVLYSMQENNVLCRFLATKYLEQRLLNCGCFPRGGRRWSSGGGGGRVYCFLAKFIL
jgi:hypothetical protein